MQDGNDNNDFPKSEVSALGSSPEGGGQEGASGYYLNEAGLVSFTAQYLLKRGYCCGNGCRHCPYNYEAVPEPKRSRLLENKNNSKPEPSE